MIGHYVRTISKRFQFSNSPALGFKPLGNLELGNPTEINSTALMTAQMICVQHPALFEVLPILISEVPDDRAVIQKVPMRRAGEA